MKLMFWLLALSGYAITVQCSLNTIVANPGGIGGIYQGPNSETIIKGPDGSLITSQETGGSINTDSKLEPIIVAESDIAAPYAPEVVSASLAPVSSPAVAAVTLSPPLEPVISATVVPITASIAPVIASVPVAESHVVEVIEQDPHIIETEIVDTPVIEPQLSSDLVGPSGSISTRGSKSIVSGPASTTISEPAKVVIAAPVVLPIPVISSITTRLQATPYVEVNDEVPLKSVSRATVAADVSLVFSTIAPIGINAISTLGPLITRDSTSFGADLTNTAINIASTSAPTVVDGNTGINVASTLAPPLIDLGNIRGNVESSSVSPQLREYNSVVSSTIASPIEGQSADNNLVLVSSASPTDLNEGYNIVQPASSYGFVDNSPPTSQVSSTPSPGVIYSSTARPPSVYGYKVPFPGDVRVPDGNIQRLDEANNRQFTGENIVQPGSSYGYISNSPADRPISSTPFPGYDFSSQSDGRVSDGNIQRLDEALANSRQFSIDPSSIPSQNIIPPEIGRLPSLPESAVDSETAFQVPSVPRAPGLVPSNPSTNIQRTENAENRFVDNSYRNINIGQQGISGRELISPGGEENLQNEIILPDSGRELGREVYQQSTVFSSTGPLLRDTNPIIDGGDFKKPTELQWERLGSQFQQDDIPPTPDSAILSLRPGDFDDRNSASLWNRYGRRTRHGKR